MMRIETEEQYEAALAEVDTLWAAGPDTPEGRRFDELVDALVVYERIVCSPWLYEEPTAEEWAEYYQDQGRDERRD